MTDEERFEGGSEGTGASHTGEGVDRTDEEGESTPADEAVRRERTGIVHLVGSGPGDPDLLTVKARRLVEEADVVLHDKLPGRRIIELVPEDKREDVGKRAGGERTPQSAIDERLVELAREGKRVVRLKGGDPFVFGRGGEEAEYLAARGIAFEVVPGVTSALAAPAVAGVPATHREHASSVSVVTGHEDPTKAESAVDWDALARTGGTIVVLMGVGKLPEYTRALREAGLDPETPVALIERGTRREERVATGTLETIVDARDEAGIEPPAVTVIGDVVGVRERVLASLKNDPSEGGDPPGEDR
jgi:uroporphyrin-III C-methyltransferase